MDTTKDADGFVPSMNKRLESFCYVDSEHFIISEGVKGNELPKLFVIVNLSPGLQK
jgi:hypothetical protein